MTFKDAFSTRFVGSGAKSDAEGGIFALAGLVAGLGAIAASSCCLVPLALASLGAGAGVFETLEAAGPWRTPLLVAGACGVGLAWFERWRRRRASPPCESDCARRPPSRASLAILLLATLTVAVAASWNGVELSLLKLMRPS
jgi:mercuric ion transport protein